MSVEFQKVTVTPGNGSERPKKGDVVTMQYTGYLYDDSKPDKKGSVFDSSRNPGREAFRTPIGVGKVIQGWDTGVVQMTVGEKATLFIPAEMGYGARGFPGHIPPNSPLIFDVELVKIN